MLLLTRNYVSHTYVIYIHEYCRSQHLVQVYRVCIIISSTIWLRYNDEFSIIIGSSIMVQIMFVSLLAA